jgi:Na+-driven multidrug efflux pump
VAAGARQRRSTDHAAAVISEDRFGAAAFEIAPDILAAVFPRAWLGLFSDDPGALALGSLYLQTVGPAYGAIGIGMTLYFASQGAKRVVWPVLAGTARMIVAALIGWLAVARYGASLSTLFQFVALSAILFGAITAAAMLGGAWERRSAGLPLARPDPAE